jgi:CRISPR/Cas system CSM-associated protein Csm3 (group 7 of RAMP superfamily)
MLKRRLCEARLTWRLSCEGPLLIADGRYEKKKTDDKDSKGKLPDKVFISRTHQKDLEEKVERARSADELRSLAFYVPGTSLRGPVRAQAERILRTVIPGAPPATACDPFEQEAVPSQSCSKRLDETHAATPYAAVCPACRLFGCTGAASRTQISDADVDKSARSVYRDMIGIDRFTGGVYQGEITAEGKKKGGANMRFHALEGASFATTMTITNFELWQLGLLAFVFRDFEDGLVSIGFGKTKGFGQVKGKVESIEVTPIVAKDRLSASAGALLQRPLTEETPLWTGIHPGCGPEAGASKAPNTLRPWLLLYSYDFLNATGGSRIPESASRESFKTSTPSRPSPSASNTHCTLTRRPK